MSNASKQSIALPGVIFTLVGFVVGTAIFVMPGELAAQTGPGLFIAFLVAGVVALQSCYVAAQIGSALPVSGSGYVGASVVLGPFAGFMIVWMVMMCMVAGIPLLAIGFADYLVYFVPGVGRFPAALFAILVFGGVNLLGVRAAVWAQALMVLSMVAVLLVFGLLGVANMNPALMRPLLPNGVGPVIGASIGAYYAYGGFMVIGEIAGEIRDPARTIPLGLMTSFLIVVGLYLLVSVALPGVMPWRELAGVKAPLAVASSRFLPAWFAAFISAAAVLGAATAINAWFMTQTRDLHMLARSGVLPGFFAHLSRRFGEPDRAILLAMALSVAGLCVGASIEVYSILVVLAMAVVQVIAGVAVMRLPRSLPGHYDLAPFKLRPRALIVLGSTFALSSAFFGVVGVLQSALAAGVFAVMLACGCLYYLVRTRQLAARGVHLRGIWAGEVEGVLQRRD